MEGEMRNVAGGGGVCFVDESRVEERKTSGKGELTREEWQEL